MHNIVHDALGRLTDKWLLVGQQLVEEHTKGKNIRLFVDPFALDLLGRHVIWRAQSHAGFGQCAGFRLGNAEVHDLDFAVVENFDVFGFDIPMDDIVLMCLCQAVAYLQDNIELFCER